jgi:hypothetical protein
MVFLLHGMEAASHEGFELVGFNTTINNGFQSVGEILQGVVVAVKIRILLE